ncbi:hypothetical protein ACFWIB_42090 [Streptomyces sp. NPDC127051]|uniref:hypothetical protein n=1 Tax=Streptomyces sp. NPDC127051 TaxID=3347119 RepID=UPI0036584775
MVHTLAREVMALDTEICALNTLIEGRFREHPDAEVITSMPGIADLFGTELIAASGGDMSAFGSPDCLSVVAALAPAHATPARSAATSAGHAATVGDSCPWSASAQVAATCCPASRAFYQRKRAEWKPTNRQAIALA